MRPRVAAGLQDPAVKEELKSVTDAAISREERLRMRRILIVDGEGFLGLRPAGHGRQVARDRRLVAWTAA